MDRGFRNYLFLGSIAGIIVLLDQASKILVRANIPLNSIWSPWEWLTPYARFYHTLNSGVAFGMLQGAGWVFAIFAILTSIAIIWYYPQVPRQDWVIRLALGMQLGGALGNLLDRIFFKGQVTDFISVGTFAIFNVADSAITVGVGVLLLGVWLQENKKKKEVPGLPNSTTENQAEYTNGAQH